MTITLTLPPDVEDAFLAESKASGRTIEVLIKDALIHAALARARNTVFHQTSAIDTSDLLPCPLELEGGVPVLRTGQPISASVVEETLERVRQERDLALLGS